MNPTDPIGPATEQWIQGRQARREITDTTAKGYRSTMAMFTTHVGPDTPISAINIETFEQWLGSQRHTHNGRPVKAATLNTRAACVRAFFTYLTQRQIIAANPTIGVRRATVGQREPRRLTDATISRLLLVADFPTTVVILLGASLGLRRAEMTALRLTDWDRANQLILVHGKGNRERTLPVGPELGEVLRIWAAGRRTGPLLPRATNPDLAVTPNTIGLWIKKAANRAGVEATTHQLRHTYAANLVADGVPLPVVQRALGHETLSTTTVYTRATAQDLQDQLPDRRWLLNQPAALTEPTLHHAA